MTKHDVLFLPEVSEIVGVSENTLRRKAWREKTGIPIRRKGKRLYAIRRELFAWLGED